MARWRRLTPATTVVALALGCAALTEPPPGASPEPSAAVPPPGPAYLFAWPDFSLPEVPVRGGTSRGAPVTLRTRPSEAWQRLQQRSLSPRERDRAAILALAGDYRVSFDFLETIVFGGQDGPARPYRSWGTERVYVLRDEPGFVQLQHVMVMFIVDDGGRTRGPFVQKHWRQDWRYEPTQWHRYLGHGVYQRETIAPAERDGAWLQIVFQVDDTPRYSLLGRWRHEPGHSIWQSEAGWRPLPRREHTVRDDYHALDGAHRITLRPTGWVHEQDHLKRVLDAPGVPSREGPVRAREIGVARYDGLDGFDFAAGDAYWQRTQGFWQLVREAWRARMASSERIRIAATCQEVPVFQILFRLAHEVEQGQHRDPAALRRRVGDAVACATREGPLPLTRGEPS